MVLDDGWSGGLFRLANTTGKVRPELIEVRVALDGMIHEIVRVALGTFLLKLYTGDTGEKTTFFSGGLVL